MGWRLRVLLGFWLDEGFVVEVLLLCELELDVELELEWEWEWELDSESLLPFLVCLGWSRRYGRGFEVFGGVDGIADGMVD
jgi:hypothetical protein